MCLIIKLMLFVVLLMQPVHSKTDVTTKTLQGVDACNYNIRNYLNTTKSTRDIIIGFLAGYGHSRVSLGALPLAVEEINKSNLIPGARLKFKAVDIGRNITTLRPLPIKFMTEMRDSQIMAFIGPDETCTSEALVAAAWNLPMLSYKCADTAVSDKTVFHSFARTLAPASKVSKSVVALLEAFEWQKFVIVSGLKPTWSAEIAQAIKVLAESRNLTVIQLKEYKDYIPTHIPVMQKIVDETYEIARIYVFVGEHIAMIDFIRCLQNRKLLETGDYMVISVDDEIYYPTKRSSILEREYLDPYLKRIRSRALELQSFGSVLKLTPSYPSNPKFEEICENIRLFSRQPPFSLPYHEKIYNNITVPIYAAHLYDAVYIYARAVSEVLQMGGNLKNGSLVMERIFNRSYHSILGFDVYIDANGDAEGNFTVIALQEDYSTSSNSSKKLSMQPVGYFLYSKAGGVPEFKYNHNSRQIRWIKRSPPKSEPLCGFYGELCPNPTKDWRFIISTILIAILLGVAGVFLLKHYRYEQTLMCLLWKVDLKEVTYLTSENTDINPRYKNMIQPYRPSIIPGVEITKRAYTTIGLYRGNIVAIKKINKKTIDLTRNIRKELKQIRELRHENIITFIGASVDTGAIAILTSYCTRGSLEDVLANEDLFLDNMFISSLVSDIVKGIIYLHDSEITSHGNLRSSNCLVDSRWVCQISDFGLHDFKSGQEKVIREEIQQRQNLWKAPEILRNSNCHPRGTQKGDIFSFGIILYEIIGRSGPWGDTTLSNYEIISKIKNSAGPMFFRPPIFHLNAPDYVKHCLRSCWEESPELRPDIRLIRIKLKEMQTGLKPNIFDNMLAIMEKYASNLEELIQERTNQLCEEKKKTEALLLRMLPKSVAESLKKGDRVEAECFDCVTIFFSDLVGFTELCAKSTPLEVVEMLNDLYTCCDSIISHYDVYKVETIGDAYMVVSGLPLRNHDRHAGEIASLSLHLLECVSKLEIRHRQGELLQIRIGIHSGQCVAGVVGLKMPRYCLFGDTVNTASRMESTGEALKIHISSATYHLLQKLGGYCCEERGLIFVKGKGEMRTYWLKNEDIRISIDQIDSLDVIEDSHSSTQKTSMKNCRNSQSLLKLSLNDKLLSTYLLNGLQPCNEENRTQITSLPNFKNKELFEDDCYICRGKNLISVIGNTQKYVGCNEDNMLKVFPVDVAYGKEGFNQCDCRHPVSTLTDKQYTFPYKFDCHNKNRIPRSAPHITFMQ